MRKEIKLNVKIEPLPKLRPRFHKKSGHTYTPTKTRNYETELAHLVSAEYEGKPLDGILECEVEFRISKPKTVDRPYPTVKPDLSNYTKALEDALNGILWKDDSQIISMKAHKRYTNEKRPYILIKVLSL